MDDGQSFGCSCVKRITLKQANCQVAAGLAIFKRTPLGAIDNRQILKTGRQVRPPRAPTIQSGRWWESLGYSKQDNVALRTNQRFFLRGHVERAYIEGSQRERDRIEAYGEMTQLMLFELGASQRPRRTS
jgi:hypothetical protein